MSSDNYTPSCLNAFRSSVNVKCEIIQGRSFSELGKDQMPAGFGRNNKSIWYGKKGALSFILDPEQPCLIDKPQHLGGTVIQVVLTVPKWLCRDTSIRIQNYWDPFGFMCPVWGVCICWRWCEWRARMPGVISAISWDNMPVNGNKHGMTIEDRQRAIWHQVLFSYPCSTVDPSSLAVTVTVCKSNESTVQHQLWTNGSMLGLQCPCCWTNITWAAINGGIFWGGLAARRENQAVQTPKLYRSRTDGCQKPKLRGQNQSKQPWSESIVASECDQHTMSQWAQVVECLRPSSRREVAKVLAKHLGTRMTWKSIDVPSIRTCAVWWERGQIKTKTISYRKCWTVVKKDGAMPHLNWREDWVWNAPWLSEILAMNLRSLEWCLCSLCRGLTSWIQEMILAPVLCKCQSRLARALRPRVALLVVCSEAVSSTQR